VPAKGKKLSLATTKNVLKDNQLETLIIASCTVLTILK
jgi:hypothetical protein